ncbi:hypothetical protein BU52_22505 [Streptomyces toyocaensis]|uniref:Uncharacterized protein n=1 Tax=Streptomyces toyocaensis TaxID=55952 RepID=A0A081XN74_STRTO|nr:hypothetical protein BU52_22505 [Streptomyces toyocaensis]
MTARIRRAVNARGHFPDEPAALHGNHVPRSTGKGRTGWAMRRRTALNAFGITFDGRLSAARQ